MQMLFFSSPLPHTSRLALVCVLRYALILSFEWATTPPHPQYPRFIRRIAPPKYTCQLLQAVLPLSTSASVVKSCPHERSRRSISRIRSNPPAGSKYPFPQSFRASCCPSPHSSSSSADFRAVVTVGFSPPESYRATLPHRRQQGRCPGRKRPSVGLPPNGCTTSARIGVVPLGPEVTVSRVLCKFEPICE